MNTLSRDIIGNIIEEQKEAGPQKVEGFTNDVRKKAIEKTKFMQEQFGDGAREITKDVMNEVESYAQARNGVYNGMTVQDLKPKKADGIYEVAKDEASVDDHYMDLLEDDAKAKELEEHGKKVVKHELVHKNDQAHEYDQDKIVLDPNAGAEGEIAVKDLTEGQPIDVAGQTPDELTDDYIKHHEQFKEVEKVVDRSVIDNALKTGKLSLVQEIIIDKKQDEFRKKLLGIEAKATQHALAA